MKVINYKRSVNNTLNASRKLLSLLKIDYTSTYLEDILLTHSDYPSLLSISDSLEKYNVDTLAVKISEEKLDEIPLPCLVQVHEKGNSFLYIIRKVEKNQVCFYNENNKSIKVSRDAFINKWTGICLLAEKNEKSKEPGIEEELKKKNLFLV